MAISTTDDGTRTSKFAAVLKADPAHASPPPKRRWRLTRWITVPLAILALLAFGVAASFPLGLFSRSTTGRETLTEKVRRADLTVTVTEDGNVESSQNIDVKCAVKGGSTILWLIKDGTVVKKGDELARLDSSSIEDQINAQKILYEKANAAKIDADKAFQTAKIAVQEYEEGTFKQQLQTLEANATVAKENLESSRNNLMFINRMLRKGYVTPLQRDAQAFAEKRAELDLAVANTAIEVLEKFTKPKMLVSLESARDTAEARRASEDAAFQLEKARLEQLEEQLQKCTIVAPDDGMVVYANDQQQFGRGGGNQQSVVEEGAIMRERQTMIKLPDLSQMQVKCTVHESKVDMLQRGMRARIRVQDHDFQGTVISVANQPEPTNFWMGAVKEYATIVKIDSDPQGLRPGLTAAVEILVANLKNVLSVQVQAVVEIGGKFYCWVRTPFGGFQKREVVLGMSNNTRVEIKDGLNESEDVLLNPRSVIEEAREEVLKEEAVDVKKKFGDDKPAQMPKSAEGAGGKQRGGKAGPMDLMSFDKDGDKKVSREEAPEQVKQFFDRMDSNSDGFIDAKEIAEARKRMQARQKEGGGPGGPGGGPGGP